LSGGSFINNVERGYMFKRENGSYVICIKHLGGKNRLWLCEDYSSNGDFLGPIKVPYDVLIGVYEPAGFTESAVFKRKD